VTIDVEPSAERAALLKIEYAGRHCVVEPREAIRLRDGLHAEGSVIGERLATLIAAKATELMAAPLYAGTVSVRIDRQEAESLEAVLAGWDADGDVSHEEGSLWTLLQVLRAAH
jgi:hypothetical protein